MSEETFLPIDPDANNALFDEVFRAVYEELRRLASFMKQGDGCATLRTTEVVSEAYLRLRNSPELARSERLHFKRLAARAMRRILVDAARRRHAEKRGGGQMIQVTIGHAAEAAVVSDEGLLELHRALNELAELDARQALCVEMKYFGGLTFAEIALELEVSERTVERQIRGAEAWLRGRLEGLL